MGCAIIRSLIDKYDVLRVFIIRVNKVKLFGITALVSFSETIAVFFVRIVFLWQLRFQVVFFTYGQLDSSK